MRADEPMVFSPLIRSRFVAGALRALAARHPNETGSRFLPRLADEIEAAGEANDRDYVEALTGTDPL